MRFLDTRSATAVGPDDLEGSDHDVDVIPTIGYRPMVTTDLDAGWTQLNDPWFSMAPHTKHGGIVSLTKAQYDTVRSADAAAAG